MWACRPEGAAHAAARVRTRYFGIFIFGFCEVVGFVHAMQGARAVRVRRHGPALRPFGKTTRKQSVSRDLHEVRDGDRNRRRVSARHNHHVCRSGKNKLTAVTRGQSRAHRRGNRFDFFRRNQSHWFGLLLFFRRLDRVAHRARMLSIERLLDTGEQGSVRLCIADEHSGPCHYLHRAPVPARKEEKSNRDAPRAEAGNEFSAK